MFHILGESEDIWENSWENIPHKARHLMRPRHRSILLNRDDALTCDAASRTIPTLVRELLPTVIVTHVSLNLCLPSTMAASAVLSSSVMLRPSNTRATRTPARPAMTTRCQQNTVREAWLDFAKRVCFGVWVSKAPRRCYWRDGCLLIHASGNILCQWYSFLPRDIEGASLSLTSKVSG